MSAHRLEVDDGLELDVVVIPEREEVVEHLALGDLGHLIHADPIAEAGNLDCLGQGHDVALGRRQLRVDVRDPVGGIPGDASDDGIAQLFGRAHDAPAGIGQLDNAGPRDAMGHPGYEPTVSGPQEPLDHTWSCLHEPHGGSSRTRPPWRAPWPGDGTGQSRVRKVSRSSSGAAPGVDYATAHPGMPVPYDGPGPFHRTFVHMYPRFSTVCPLPTARFQSKLT